MRSEPAYYPLIRIAIALGGALVGFVAMGLVGVAVDVPVKAKTQAIEAAFGTLGVYVALVAPRLANVSVDRAVAEPIKRRRTLAFEKRPTRTR